MINYGIGRALQWRDLSARAKWWILCLGVAGNLLLIAYYKYLSFLVSSVIPLVGIDVEPPSILLPLAISFFTFQQIAYLVDSYRSEVREHSIIHYAVFVTFFPQLIAGPIVHHKDILPQFQKVLSNNRIYRNLSIGITIFIIGLFKKVVLADGIAPYSDELFNSVATSGVKPDLITAWAGALSYTFQLYFDFSGYSDMAVGLARMFGICLPINFYSPYKACNIIDFWRRWHISLSTFLRDYVYIPLGGNRLGSIHRYKNIMITMLLGGLWHGAGWTFVIWEALHGFYIMINHGFQLFRQNVLKQQQEATAIGIWFGRILTFGIVVIAWVVFRAESFSTAWTILEGMFGRYGLGVESFQLGLSGFIMLLLILCWFSPNVYQIMSKVRPVIMSKQLKHKMVYGVFVWKPTFVWGVLTVCLALITYVTIISGQPSEFLYFQF